MISYSALNLGASRDFVAIAGRWRRPDYHESPISTTHIVRDVIDVANATRQYFASSSGFSIQFIRRGTLNQVPPANPSNQPIWSLAGSVRFPTLPDDAILQFHSLATHLTAIPNKQRIQSLSSIRGNFVATISTASALLLWASTESITRLFYSTTPNGSVMWSTSFLDLIERPLDQINRDALAFMAWGGNQLPYSGIGSLAPGEYLYFDAHTRFQGNLKPEYREASPYRSVYSVGSLRALGEELRELLLKAVRQQTQSFRRIGVVLSGGIDSSAVAQCLADANKDMVLYNWASRTYPPADESRFAQMVAEHLGVPIRYIDIAKYRNRGGTLIDPSWRFVTPHNHALFAWWLETVEAASHDGVDCLMSGFGGDGRFSGQVKLKHAFRKMPGFGLGSKAQYLWQALSLPFLSKDLLCNNVRSPVSYYYRQPAFFTDAGKRAVERLDMQPESASLQDLSTNHHFLYPYGLSFVSPYFDASVKSFAEALPEVYRALPYSGQVIQKPVLRQAFFGRLPQEIVQRTPNPHLNGIVEGFCINNTEVIERILGQGSQLASLGVVDIDRLNSVLREPNQISASSDTLTVSCLVELWLQSLRERETT